jgi:hypothetical protein
MHPSPGACPARVTERVANVRRQVGPAAPAAFPQAPLLDQVVVVVRALAECSLRRTEPRAPVSILFVRLRPQGHISYPPPEITRAPTPR